MRKKAHLLSSETNTPALIVFGSLSDTLIPNPTILLMSDTKGKQRGDKGLTKGGNLGWRRGLTYGRIYRYHQRKTAEKVLRCRRGGGVFL